MNRHQYNLPSKDGINKIHCVHWQAEKPVALLQIVHGMTEFIERYDDFARFLCSHNISVVGHDHLGHGETAKTSDDFGFFHTKYGAEYLVEDTYTVTKNIKETYPETPIFILGHSMGSFCTRMYLTKHADLFSGAIIMGTGHPAKLLTNFATKGIGLYIRLKGERYRSQLISKFVFFQYMKGISKPKTSVDWISRDEEMTKKYLATPFCTFTFTLRAYEDLFRMIHHCIYEIDLEQIPKDMPILITSGGCDPVGDWGKSPNKVYQSYLKHGLQNVELKLYPEDRHEILNELDRDVVYADLLQWILNHLQQC
ncbi:alpha/beta hydrolase [Chakrabartyella piscis]|uniref:alpha/beta hydrolase n=1 Tax=Chakrabartyella piscis TaxID=2918914 RepID=UPI0029588C67|nr:alpha/beta hydrolase [Chakrabartyella piscis]